MYDNPAAAQAPAFALSGYRVVALSGRDATAFAQAQFMNDVAALAPGRWQWSGWLTPKGRVIALFALLRIEADALWLLFADADADAIAARLRGFVFRSKVAIDVRDDLRVSAAFALPHQARSADFARLDDGRIELDFGGDGGARVAWIAPRTKADAPVDADAAVRWTRADLAHGLPHLPGQEEQWTPQQLSLDRLRAYSVKKGCYPGQEIVARTHFLGQAKRGLVLLALPEAARAGTGITQSGRSIGSLVCTVAGTPTLGLAVLPIEREDVPLQIDDADVEVRPLLDGLAR